MKLGCALCDHILQEKSPKGSLEARQPAEKAADKESKGESTRPSETDVKRLDEIFNDLFKLVETADSKVCGVVCVGGRVEGRLCVLGGGWKGGCVCWGEGGREVVCVGGKVEGRLCVLGGRREGGRILRVFVSVCVVFG